MKQAIRVYSAEKGYFSQQLIATDIKSHAHARKLAPFVDDNKKLLYWVTWGKFKKNGKHRVAHFRHYPNNKRNVSELTDSEIKLRRIKSNESKKHKNAKDNIALVLKELLSEKKHLPWAYSDPEISEFPLTGDFLANAVSIEKEYTVTTPFDEEYRLDIAIIGEKLHKKPIVLAGIEVEFKHKFDFSKALFCKTLGFPLVSVDVTDIDLKNINKSWAKKTLMETTRGSSNGRRTNYIYIHPMLSTIYIDIPRYLKPESKHQYVIFTKEQDRLISYLKKLKYILKLTDAEVAISPITDKNSTLHVQVKNAGNLAGENWKDHNPNSYIQLTTEKPITKSGSLYYFHLILTSLCNAVLDCLVGYKFELGEKHTVGDSLQWRMGRKINGNWKHYRVAPKRVSEPVVQILNYVK